MPNTPVLINDINVGTVTNVGLDNWTPVLTLSLRKDVKLPANAIAKLGQTSLLGSKHVELSGPTDGTAPQGVLRAGAVIPQDRTQHYPETEDVLSGVSLLLNGGGLQHFQTITSELNRALGGRENDAREFLTQLNDFTTGLDKQKDDITGALKGLDRLGGTLAPRMDEISTALQTLPDGLRTLDEQEPALLKAAKSIGDSNEVFSRFTGHGGNELKGIFDELEPVLRHIGDTRKDSVIKSLKLLPFVIFPLDTIPYAFRGDYVHIIATVDLTNEALDRAFLTGTPLGGSTAALSALQGGKLPGLQAANPLQLPTAGTPGGAPKAPSVPSGGGLLDKPLKGIGG